MGALLRWTVAVVGAVLIALIAFIAVQPQGHAADTTPPVVTIDSGPGDTSAGSATFTFSANEPSTFKCELLTSSGTIVSGWAACTSPKTYSGLANGGYTFKVKAKDTAGNNSTAAKKAFTVSTTTTKPQCSDGVDNDGDGLIDYPNDPGCTSATDTDETNATSGSAELIGAGDIADGTAGAGKTAAIIKNHPSASVFTAGDNAYNSGTITEYNNNYDPTWGAFKARTNPTPGNHEYNTANAAGYKQYFGSQATPNGNTYYAKNVGDWRIYYLDANISASSSSAQYTWLKNDLAANPKTCSLATWHQPVFSSGQHGNTATMKSIYALLDSNGADVVVNGHDHDYERFAPQDSNGTASASGIREFVVGTGGTADLRGWGTTKPNSQVRIANRFGVIDFQLGASNYSWQWIPTDGGSGDSGSANCVTS